MNAPARLSLDRVSTALPARPQTLQRKCACGAPAPADGTCGRCKAKGQAKLQARLAVGPVDDPLEREADRIAAQVMASSLPDPAGGVPVRVQRAGGAGDGALQAAPPSVEATLAATGRPLEGSVRHDMEQRFGRSFFDVRVHDDPLAQASARDVDAAAYTSGSHVVFAAGRYAPGSREGRQLLAHELAHVLQQSAPGAMPVRRRIQRQTQPQAHPQPQPAGPAEAQGVARLKWSEESERTYRASGDARAANAIQACRLQGGAACALLVTEEEAAAIVASETKQDPGSAAAASAPAAPAPAGAVALPFLVPGGLGSLGSLAPQAGAAAPATGSAGGLAAAGPALPAGLIAAGSAYAVWRYTAPQRLLIARGYIILRPPLAACIGGCHLAVPRPDTFPRLFPDIGAAVPGSPSKRRSPRDLGAILSFLQPYAPAAGTTHPGPSVVPPLFPIPLPWDLSRRQRGEKAAPFAGPLVDPWGETSPRDPCDDSVLHRCSPVDREDPMDRNTYESEDEAVAELRKHWGPLVTGGREGATDGHCFTDRKKRSDSEATDLGATHTTYRIPKMPGPRGIVGSVVCCRCCMSVKGESAAQFRQRCTIKG